MAGLVQKEDETTEDAMKRLIQELQGLIYQIGTLPGTDTLRGMGDCRGISVRQCQKEATFCARRFPGQPEAVCRKCQGIGAGAAGGYPGRDISIQIGIPWIEAEDYEAFLYENAWDTGILPA